MREPTSFWPHSPGDVKLVRESLQDLALQVGLPPPDDGILRQVLDGARGASGLDICHTLVGLWKRQKFRGMYSWGLLPMVVKQCYQVA